MRSHAPVGLLAGLITLIVSIVSCGKRLHTPCPMPIAVTVTDAATGGPISDAFLSVSGSTVTAHPCVATCSVSGTAGTYTLEVRAPGFETARRTVTVRGTTPSDSDCDCPTVTPEHVAIALVARP